MGVGSKIRELIDYYYSKRMKECSSNQYSEKQE
mgnify:CR=1 FL=1